MNKSKLVIALSILVIFLLYFFWGIPYQTRLTNRNFKQFYESNLNGKLSYVGIKNQGSSFKVDSSEITYVFYPYADKLLNDKHSFSSFASPGDQVVKPAFSDTLVLIKQDKSYKFTFRKFN